MNQKIPLIVLLNRLLEQSPFTLYAKGLTPVMEEILTGIYPLLYF